MVYIVTLEMRRKGIRTHISTNSVSGNRNSRRNYFRQRLQVHFTLLTNDHTSHRDENEAIVSISCTNRWADRTNESSSRAVLTSVHRLSTNQLNTIPTHRAVFLQQRDQRNHENDAILRTIWVRAKCIPRTIRIQSHSARRCQHRTTMETNHRDTQRRNRISESAKTSLL